MTIEQALVKARAGVEAYFAEMLDDYEALLRKHGATDAELDAELTWYAKELATEKERMLLKLKGLLERDGTLH
jgi:hypothetical protein